MDFSKLTELRFVEGRYLALLPIFQSTQATLSSILETAEFMTIDNSHAMRYQQDLQRISNYQRRVAAYEGNLQHLLRQVRSAIAFLVDTSRFSKQYTEKDESALRLQLSLAQADDSATVRALTNVTLVYLSFTSVAVGRPFFL